MRNLKTSDIFALGKVLKITGVKDDIKKAFEDGKKMKGKDAQEKMGLDIFLLLLEASGTSGADSAMYELLAGPFEKTADEVRDMDLTELMKLMEELFKKNDMNTFFKQAGL